jgi:hypothetical protein
MINWLKKEKTLISSLIIWNHEYEPYQVVILRSNHASDNNLIFYFQLDDGIVANQHSIGHFRTNTDEEVNFHVARLAREFLDKQGDKSILEGSANSPDDSLKDSLKEVFLSPIAIELMREKHPEFGFYSNSPNLKKIEKIMLGTYEGLLGLIYKLNNRNQ